MEAFDVLVHVFVLRWLGVDVPMNCLLTNFFHFTFAPKIQEQIYALFILLLCFSNFRLERMLFRFFVCGNLDLFNYIQITGGRLLFLVVKFLFAKDVLQS